MAVPRLASFGFAFLILALLPGNPAARYWYVYPDGSGDAPTINAAFDSAGTASDTIIVGCGTYDEPDIERLLAAKEGGDNKRLRVVE